MTISESTDFLNTRADALVDLAADPSASGPPGRGDAQPSTKGIALYEQKGNSVAAEQARAHLAVLQQV